MAEKTNAPGFNQAGFTDIITSDGIVHGQVKQSANFAFSRVYYSGHEVPFYQPLLALEMFERVLAGKDVATGQTPIAGNYSTVGPAESTFREGNATVQWEVVSTNATYNTTTGAPNPVASNGTTALEPRSTVRSLKSGARASRSQQSRGMGSLLRQNKRWT